MIHYVYYRVNSDLFSTVAVRVPEGAQPLIRCDTKDVNGLDDGRGNFIRTFAHKKRAEVTLSAPARYGVRPFLGWRVADDADGGDLDRSSDPSKLVQGRTLKVNVQRVRNRLVEPVYGAPGP